MRLESKEKRVTKMKLLTKIRKADPIRKTEIWQSLNLSNDERDQLIRDMVLSLPKGAYKIHDRQYGTNLVDKIYEIYGWMPSMLVSESTMLGLQALYPNRVYASFTLGLDAIEIK
jgi:hypothetical protein